MTNAQTDTPAPAPLCENCQVNMTNALGILCSSCTALFSDDEEPKACPFCGTKINWYDQPAYVSRCFVVHPRSESPIDGAWCILDTGDHFNLVEWNRRAASPALTDTQQQRVAEDRSDWPRRFAVFAFDLDGYDSLTLDQQQVCQDAATWAARFVDDALAARSGAGDADTTLDRFSTFPPKWDSYDGKVIDPRAIETARKLVRLIAGQWSIVPCSDGGIQVERHAEGLEVEIAIPQEGATTFFVEGSGDAARQGSQPEDV